MTRRLATALLGFVLTALALTSAPVAAMEPDGPEATITGGGKLEYTDSAYVGAEFGVAAVMWPSGITVGQFSIVIEFTSHDTLAFYGLVTEAHIEADHVHLAGMGTVRETLIDGGTGMPGLHPNVAFDVMVGLGEMNTLTLILQAPRLDGQPGDNDLVGAYQTAMGEVIEGQIVIELRKVA